MHGRETVPAVPQVEQVGLTKAAPTFLPQINVTQDGKLEVNVYVEYPSSF